MVTVLEYICIIMCIIVFASLLMVTKVAELDIGMVKMSPTLIQWNQLVMD